MGSTLSLMLENIIQVAEKCIPGYNYACEHFGRLAQLVRAPRLHRGGRRFESYTAHRTGPIPNHII
jgi:hypothetical protein